MCDPLSLNKIRKLIEENINKVDFTQTEEFRKEMLNKEHEESEYCWCEPELVSDFSKSGGAKHYVHKEIQ